MTTKVNEAPTRSLLALEATGTGRVVSVRGDGPDADRLRELGFTPGTEVTFVRRAPMGDPWCFRLRGTELCLRATEARLVEVEAGPS